MDAGSLVGADLGARVSYRQHQPSIYPFRDTAGQAWAAEFGGAKDGVASRTREATLAHFPSSAPTDALGRIGNDRGLPQGPAESTADYRLRLADAWDAWSGAGGPLAMLDQLAALGYDATTCDPVIVQQNGRAYRRHSSGALITDDLGPNWAISGSPPWWTFDDNTALWTRFAIVIPSLPYWWTTPTNPPVSDPSLEEVNSIRRVIAKWKPAKAACVGIVVVTSGNIYGWPLTEQWGGATTWGSSSSLLWSAAIP